MSLYPTFDISASSSNNNSPMRSPYINYNSQLKPSIKDFQEFKYLDIMQFHCIDLKNDDFSQLIRKENEKLISVNKYPDDIFLAGFCFWFDNNFKVRGKTKENLVIYFNKMRKDPRLLLFANSICEKYCKYQFDDRYLRSLTSIFDYNIDINKFHETFYNSISKSQSGYLHIIYSVYMRICCFYILLKVQDCFLLKDKNIIQECLKNSEHYSKFIEDFKSKSFYSEEYKVILNLLCEAIGISVKLITINKTQRIFLKETFPTNINKAFDLYKQIIKLKFLIVIDKENSAVYRAYRLPNENHKFCLQCKGSFETKTKSNLKNFCLDCFKTSYCCMNKELLEKDDFFESNCKHRYCKNCLIFLYNSNQEKSNMSCCILDCKKPIAFSQIENFLRNRTPKQKSDLEDFQCPYCQKKAIVSKIQNNNYVFCCKICDKNSCLLHKCSLENCFCYCPKCKVKYNSSFQEVGNSDHIELLECFECKTLVCKTCKQVLKNYSDWCPCKCHLCFNLLMAERENNGTNNNKLRCRSCFNMCNVCFVNLKQSQVHFCKKCKMMICRVCLNEIVINEKYQYFSKKEFCIYCDSKKK